MIEIKFKKVFRLKIWGKVNIIRSKFAQWNKRVTELNATKCLQQYQLKYAFCIFNIKVMYSINLYDVEFI